MAEITSEINRYINDSIKEFYNFNYSVAEILRKTLLVNAQLIKEGGNVKKNIESTIKSFRETMEYVNEELEVLELKNKPIINELYNFLNDNLEKKNLMIQQQDIDYTIFSIITKFKKEQLKEKPEKNKVSAIIYHLTESIIGKYLFNKKQLIQTTNGLNDEWYNFVFKQYSSEENREDTLEKRITSIMNNNQEWEEALLNNVSSNENENIIFKGFDEWLKDNYKQLVTDFYKWSENKKQYTPLFQGLLVTAILRKISRFKEDKPITTRSGFIKKAKEVIDKLTNKELIKTINNLKETEIEIYKLNMNSEISYYLSYLKNNNINNEILTHFSQVTGARYINIIRKSLSKRIKEYEKTRDYREKYGKWIKGVAKNFNKLLSQGIKDEFFSKINNNELNNLFKTRTRTTKLEKIMNIRADYGKIRIILKEIFKRRNKTKKEAELIAEEMIEEQWNKYMEGENK